MSVFAGVFFLHLFLLSLQLCMNSPVVIIICGRGVRIAFERDRARKKRVQKKGCPIDSPSQNLA